MWLSAGHSNGRFTFFMCLARLLTYRRRVSRRCRIPPFAATKPASQEHLATTLLAMRTLNERRKLSRPSSRVSLPIRPLCQTSPSSPQHRPKAIASLRNHLPPLPPGVKAYLHRRLQCRLIPYHRLHRAGSTTRKSVGPSSLWAHGPVV